MLVGIDVTHPSPGSVKEAPSIAAIVASIDKRFAQFPGSIRIQESRKEMVSDLDEMFRSRLILYREKNKALPTDIMVYRDGVSEGQYNIVLREELPALKAACRKVYGDATQPRISIIVVGKRHHTRFYPTDKKDADGTGTDERPKTTGNPKPGTIVDRGITMEQGWDFYLQPHKCLQGTAKPAHYIVIHHEMKLDANEMESIVRSSTPIA